MNKVTYTLSDLTFGYGNNPTLKAMNITLEPGGLHVIVGPNGSGKSTLLTLMAGHTQPDSGQIQLNDTPLAAIKPSKLARLVALVPQEFDFKFPFSVFDAVLMGRHPHIPRFNRPGSEDISIVEKAMDIMDIAPLADRPLYNLSGGEKQRTVVARALAQTTPCLLLDEPTSSMDIRHALTTLSELRKLAHDQGCTIVTVLHDLNLAAAYADTITILRNGSLHSHGSAGETLTPTAIREVFGVSASVTRDHDSACPVITYDSKELL